MAVPGIDGDRAAGVGEEGADRAGTVVDPADASRVGTFGCRVPFAPPEGSFIYFVTIITC